MTDEEQETRMANRFQSQPWYIKLWRYRWYLTIPHVTIRCWWVEWRRPLDDEDDWKMTFAQSWGLAKGLAQIPMGWWFTMDEVAHKLDRIRIDKEETGQDYEID